MAEEKITTHLDQGSKSAAESDQPRPAADVSDELGAAIAKNAISFFTPAAPVKSPSWLAVAAVSLLISMVASVGSVYVYDRFYAQKVVAVDIKGFIAEQKALYMAGKINDEQFRANVDKMTLLVKAIPKNRVAIIGDAVIRNAEIKKLP